MTMFKWFSKKTKPDIVRRSAQTEPAQFVAVQPESPLDRGKQQRHVRREQLYVAIRGAMTRSGVLSAGYKFKVLSIDQPGDQFMVLVDLAPDCGVGLDKLNDMEAAVIQDAKDRFEIVVPTVYWRLASAAVIMTAPRRAAAARNAVPAGSLNAAIAPHYANKLEDEIVAFNQALLEASAKSRSGLTGETAKQGGKSIDYRSLVDFADTEMTGSGRYQAMPALGNTQYGDLN
jgi:hypothetical protein